MREQWFWIFFFAVLLLYFEGEELGTAAGEATKAYREALE